MRFEITDGILEKCEADQDETAIILPDTVTAIAKDAFSDIRYGQIREIRFPDSLRKVHWGAFQGLGPLKEVIIYSYDPKEERIYDDEFEGKFCELSWKIRTEKLIILKGKRGNSFRINEWFDCVRLNLCVFPDVDLGTEDDMQDDFHLRCLNIFGSGPELSEKEILNRIPFADEAQIIRFQNTCVDFLSAEGTKLMTQEFSADALMKNQFEHQVTHAYGEKMPYFVWQSVNPEDGSLGLRHLTKVKELVLPEGLEKISGDIIKCRCLEKLVIPSSVRTIEDSIRDCGHLVNVYVDIHADGHMHVNASSFYGCEKLTDIILYQKDHDTGNMQTVDRIPKSEWLRYHFLKEVIDEYEAQYPILSLSTMFTSMIQHSSLKRKLEKSGRLTDFLSRVCRLKAMADTIQAIAEDQYDVYSDAEIHAARQYLSRIEAILRAAAYE